MDLSIGTLVGQIIGLILIVLLVVLLVQIPISLRHISKQLQDIKEELGNKGGRS